MLMQQQCSVGITGILCRVLLCDTMCNPLAPRASRQCLYLTPPPHTHTSLCAGIISCLSFNPLEPDLFAAGSYSRCIGLFDGRTREQLLWLQGHTGGITQVRHGVGRLVRV